MPLMEAPNRVIDVLYNTLRPIKGHKYMEVLSKLCTKCEQVLSISCFYETKSGNRRSPSCKPCQRSAVSSSKKKNHAKYLPVFADRHLVKTYGITLQQKQKMFDAQDGKCFICSKSFESLTKAHVDHDHDTKVVRDLLCGNCNKAIGLLKEDINVVMAVKDYLISHKVKV